MGTYMKTQKFGIPEIDKFCKNHKDERVRILGQKISEYRSKLARIVESEAYDVKLACGCSDIMGVDISYFAQEEIKIGDLLFQHPTNQMLVTKKPEGLPIGVSIYNMVTMDMNIYQSYRLSDVAIGGKIGIMKSGEISGKFPLNWQLPVGQKLYYDAKSDKITWRKTPIKYGKTISKQDELGFVKIRIKF
jgi:hypothetical protein